MKNKLTLIIFCIFLFQSTLILAQGKNYNWLLGYTTNPSLNKARISFDNNSYSITSELRKIPFSDTQGNISDENGDLLMSSNGYFIANATGDTMQNGAGINPGLFTDDYGSTNGMILPYGNIILPMPSDSTRYVLCHQTGNYNSSTLASSEISYSTIDMSLDGAWER
ncbi:MAG: hypothetical protein IPN13_18150 [Bacteroidetes bacterium]|nr:hypothetical protein [Bacteroidota bacterium]